MAADGSNRHALASSGGSSGKQANIRVICKHPSARTEIAGPSNLRDDKLEKVACERLGLATQHIVTLRNLHRRDFCLPEPSHERLLAAARRLQLVSRLQQVQPRLCCSTEAAAEGVANFTCLGELAAIAVRQNSCDQVIRKRN